MRRFIAALSAWLLWTAAAQAADFETGMDAYERGDWTAAYAEFLPLAEQGEAGAQYFLGDMYYLGRGVPESKTEAAAWYHKAAEQGHAKAQHNLGRMYEAGPGVPRDDAEAAAWYRKAAEQGHADAQYHLGLMYEGGHGVPESNAEAAAWYRKAAEQGYDRAQYSLGDMYYFGRGVPEDYVRAYAWVNLAAEQGNEFYARFRDVLRDDMTAFQIERAKTLSAELRRHIQLRKDAEQGDAAAQFDLGRMYAEGWDVPRDYAEAAAWYLMAAEQGHADAQFNLGVMYDEGRGVPQDDVQAYAWLNLAAEQGNQAVARFRDVLRDDMTAAQIAEAQTLSGDLLRRIEQGAKD